MFNLLLALITGVVIGWNFHSFFMELNPPQILQSDVNFSKLSQKETNPKPMPSKIKELLPVIEVVKIIKKDKIPQNIISKEVNTSKNISPISENFYTLLENNLFSDAMAFYIDARGTTLSLYHATLLKYFETKITTDPQMALEQMLELQELEPKERRVNEEELQNIEYANNPTEQAKVLLELIKQTTEKKQEYQHKISLQKVGEHFTVEVQINNTSLTLLLDTGATLTMVNEAKLPLLTLLKENIVLNTAGGQINAQLQVADTFSVGDIELEKFQIVSSSFEQKEADGLLGMNFFKKFKFKIDQEEAILYLSPKI